MGSTLLTETGADRGSMKPGKRSGTRLIMPSLTLAVGMALVGGVQFAFSAPSARTLSVCMTGPPACDFETIQQGLQAAAAGDTVLVEPGEYQGPIALKDQVALRSTQGQDVTIIKADRGPVVLAQDVVSATLAGFTVDGTNITDETVGIRAISSQLSLIDNTIQHFQTPNDLSGTVAIGIKLSGGGRLTIEATTIADIRGGEGYPGGSAIGVMAIGGGPIEIQATELTIERLEGGDAGRHGALSSTSGGDAIAIRTEGPSALILRDSLIRDLQAGAPYDAGFGCFYYAGAVAGIEARGGSVSAVDNTFSHLSQWASLDGPPGYAIHTVATQFLHLEGNVIDHLMMASRADWTTGSQAPTGPFCAPPPGTVIAIASEGDAHLTAIANSVTSVHGGGVGGIGIGIDAAPTGHVTLLRNRIRDVSGGSYFGFTGLTCAERNACAIGLRISGGSGATINANDVSQVIGGGDMYWRECMGSTSSTAIGLSLHHIDTFSLANNVVRSVHGGPGSICTTWYPYPTPHGTEGGDSVALYIAGNTSNEQSMVANNVFHLTAGGQGGGLGAPNGEGVAVYVEGGATAELINNMMTITDVGIRSSGMASALGDYNDFWQVLTNYDGVLAGTHDLQVAPGFVDPDNGNFLLLPGSPLIDAGRNQGAPTHDIEGDPRPLDGDGDGLAVVDIGVDEFWQGLNGSDKSAEPLALRAGDVISYQLKLINASTRHDLERVAVTDTLPSDVHYVDGSLWAASGAYSYTAGVITWNGSLPTNSQVTITYQAVVEELITGPRRIMNQAVLDDHVGRPRAVSATVYVNPVSRYFPVAPMMGSRYAPR